MFLLFCLIVLSSLWVLGATIVTQEGMGLYKIRTWAEAQNKTVFEPVILCVWCMPSIHSLIGYGAAIALGLINQLHWSLIAIYPLVVAGTSLLSGLVWTAYEYLAKKLELAEIEVILLRPDLEKEIKEGDYEKEYHRVFEEQ